jgi:hypothetical protein
MLRLTFFWLFFLGSFCTPAFAQLFEIALPTFSSSISDDGDYNPLGPAVDGKISRSSLSRGLLYFSFTVVAGKPAMDYLRNKFQLDVDAVILGDRSRRIAGLGISPEKWSKNRDAWTSQYDKLGYFTFRTYLYTEAVVGDALVLQVRDAGGHIVKPVANDTSTYSASVTIGP